ncbi:MAG TPA: YeeE/YedE family protein [Fluviicoccus sp.]|nr:YeeE/YedE family protein [Fluviicoccus sp.]
MADIAWISLIGGGVLIGLAAALLLLVNGRIAGISGVLGRVIHGDAGDSGWRWFFLLGLVMPILLPGASAPVTPPASPAVLAVAGLLVGLGVSIGSGCTSGHGVCGIANLSRRSLAATMLFMTTAFVTVFVVRHVLGGGV